MKKSLVLICVSTLFLFSCAAGSYTPPSVTEEPIANYIVIEKPYDVVWAKLITQLATTYFGIENYEKQSGLITLTFGASNPSNFITGGNVYVEQIGAKYKGDYISYLCKYSDADFTAKMNIVVTALGEKQTKVTVNARYVFTSYVRETNEKNTWSFNTNGYDKVEPRRSLDSKNTFRIVKPTHRAEKDLLDSLVGF